MKTTKKALSKHPKAEKLHYKDEDIRWATPEAAADYRAERLKCKVIADLGCGIGFQAFSFAKKCRKVYAVELNKEKITLAEKNAEILGLKNIEFIHGDILDEKVISKLKDVEIVFCDPERLPEEKQRSVASIKPDIRQLLDKYSEITEKIAIEFPPQITDIPFDCEKEYLSIDGQLNRLTLYFDGLKKCDRSVVVLPSGKKLCSSTAVLEETEELGSYLYEADAAVVKAGLLAELCQETGAKLYFSGKAVFFTGDKKLSSHFFKNNFKILESCKQDQHEIVEVLKKNDAGKVVLRLSVDPDEYWRVRNKLESRLTGKKSCYLFYFNDLAVIAEKV